MTRRELVVQRIVNGQDENTEEERDVRNGQVGDIDREGIPPHPEAEEPEEDPVLHKAQRGDAHDDPVYYGNGRVRTPQGGVPAGGVHGFLLSKGCHI